MYFVKLSKIDKCKKSVFIHWKKNDEVVVETQVLGVKPPQICKKNNTQKFGDTKKEKGPKVWWCKIGKNKE